MKKMCLEIEDMDTWPKEFLKLATSNKKLILSYHKALKKIDNACEEDVMKRFLLPKNIYLNEYEKLLAELNAILIDYNLIGYHCTKLTELEINDIKYNGLKVLSSDLITKRFCLAERQGFISSEDASNFLKSTELESVLNHKQGVREGTLWFCSNRSTLREPGMVQSFFEFWGGEAVRRNYKIQEQGMMQLKRIGNPCVVKCSIPFKDIKNVLREYAEYLVSYFISKDIENPEPSAKFDIRIARDLDASEIENIFDISNPNFEKLTGWSLRNLG